MDDLLDLDLRSLLELFARAGGGPAVGSAAALVTAAAAALVAKVARTSAPDWERAAAAAAQAEALRARAEPLALEDAAAYAAAAKALEEAEAPGDERRDFELGRALEKAAEVPLRIAETASDVTELAALAAEEGSPAARPDAVGAAMLAEASTRAAAHLVEVNLAVPSADGRRARCDVAVADAAAALRRALAAAS